MKSTRIQLFGVLGLAAVFAACGTEEGLGPDPTDEGGNQQNTNEDQTAPTILSVVPADGATAIELNTNVVVTFSEPIDAASVSTSSFTVGSVAGTIQVAGAVATFDPTDSYSAGSSLSVNLSTSVADLAGNSLSAPFSSSFTTRDGLPTMADAGTDMEAAAGASVTLDGSGSEGEGLSYAWTQLGGSDVGNLIGATPTFAAPASIGSIEFELQVTGAGGEALDTVLVLLLEDPAHAYWVSSAGSDADPGTRTAPFATVQAAINAADNAGNGGDVYVAAGVYDGSLELKSRVSVYGGFDPTTWRRDLGLETTVHGGPTAVFANSANNLVVEALTVIAADATDPGSNSIAMLLKNSEGVELRWNSIAAGMGADGSSGSPGDAGSRGSAGSDGSGAAACVTNRSGGGGGGNYRAGGRGGNGRLFAGTGGGDGTGSPGTGGGRGSTYRSGSGGTTGSTGSTGGDGSGGESFGALDENGYLPSSGANGGDGGHGGGGGGGGGAGGTGTSCGPGGGGGGGGGQRGTLGTAGSGGGASLGILLLGSTDATLSENSISTSAGGIGGIGGRGGNGGPGGNNGDGGNRGCEWPLNTPCTGYGGDGGDGGSGGRGGHGGGGGGGPSIGILESAGSSAALAGNTYELGAGGAGGASNNSQNTGAIGEQAEHKKVT